MKPKRTKTLFTNVSDSSCTFLQHVNKSPPHLLLRQSEELSEEDSLSQTKSESNPNSSTEINEKTESKISVVETKLSNFSNENPRNAIPKNKLRRVSFNTTKELNIIDFTLNNAEHKRQITIPLDLKQVRKKPRKKESISKN